MFSIALKTDRRRRVVPQFLAAGLVVATLAGCGDDQSDQEAYCEAGESLESSVAALANLDLVAEGTSGLDAAVDAFQDDVDELADTASDAAEADVDALEQSVDELGDAISALGSDITTENADSVAAAIDSVSASAQAVYGTLTDCP